MSEMVERFEALYIPEPNSGCWLWLGCGVNGYGQFRVDGKMVRAHRWSYEHHKRPIPEGLQIDHLCRVRCCVNPDHLEPVTASENVQRGRAKFQKTHCKRGHPLSGDNLHIQLKRDGRSFRSCKACQRLRVKKFRSKAMLTAALDETGD